MYIFFMNVFYARFNFFLSLQMNCNHEKWCNILSKK